MRAKRKGWPCGHPLLPPEGVSSVPFLPVIIGVRGRFRRGVVLMRRVLAVVRLPRGLTLANVVYLPRLQRTSRMILQRRLPLYEGRMRRRRRRVGYQRTLRRRSGRNRLGLTTGISLAAVVALCRTRLVRVERRIARTVEGPTIRYHRTPVLFFLRVGSGIGWRRIEGSAIRYYCPPMLFGCRIRRGISTGRIVGSAVRYHRTSVLLFRRIGRRIRRCIRNLHGAAVSGAAERAIIAARLVLSTLGRVAATIGVSTVLSKHTSLLSRRIQRTMLHKRPSVFDRRMHHGRAGHNGALIGHNLGMGNNARASQIGIVHAHYLASHRLRAAECFRGHGGCAHALVSVADFTRVPHIDVVVHDGHIANRHIGDVHLAQVTVAVVIPREVRIARSQREPALHADSKGDAATAHESDQRGSVHRPDYDWPGDPSPARADGDPAAVMERSEAPGLIFHPGPSPWFHPGPVPVTIRNPADGNAAREPDLSVLGNALPGAVIVQVGVSRNVVANVFTRTGREDAAVTVSAPVVEIVSIWRRDKIYLHVIRSSKFYRLTGMHGLRKAVAVDLEIAAIDGHQRGGIVGVDLHAIASRAQQRERGAGSIYFDGVSVANVIGAYAERTLCHSELHQLIVQGRGGQIGAGGKPHGDVAGFQFGAAILVGEDAVAGGQRVVQRGLAPLVFARGLKRYITADVAEPRHPSRRIILIGEHGRCQPQHKKKHCWNTELASQKSRHGPLSFWNIPVP